MIGWSAAGFVAINVVAVKLFDWQPARRTRTHACEWPDHVSKGPSDSLIDRLSLALLILKIFTL